MISPYSESMLKLSPVEDRKMTCTQGRLDYDWIYSLKILAHFRSKVLVDFHHSVKQINCLTGAIISETYIRHILWMNIFNDYTILHTPFWPSHRWIWVHTRTLNFIQGQRWLSLSGDYFSIQFCIPPNKYYCTLCIYTFLAKTSIAYTYQLPPSTVLYMQCFVHTVSFSM